MFVRFIGVTEILPSQPLNVQVTPLTDTSFGVAWKEPFNKADTVNEYTVNVTMLRSFDPTSLSSAPWDNSSQSIVTPHSVQVNVKVSENTKQTLVLLREAG